MPLLASLVLFGAWAMPLAAMPRIIKEVLETNTRYLSGPAARSVLSGGSVRVTNHISRRGYNVAGKVVKARVIPESAGTMVVDGVTTPTDEPDEASLYETGDRPGPDPKENADREASRRHDTPVPEGMAVQTKTDVYGRASFLFKPASGHTGPVDIQVYFVNQSTGFSEHTALHRIDVVSRPRALTEAGVTLIALLGVIALSIAGQRAQWRPEPPVWEEVLFPWATPFIPRRTTTRDRAKALLTALFAGALISLALTVMPSPAWGIATALGFTLFAVWKRNKSPFPFFALMGLGLWWAALGASLGQPSAAFESLMPDVPWVPWALAPALSILAPCPALSLPLLTSFYFSHVLTLGQALLGLLPYLLGAALVFGRKA